MMQEGRDLLQYGSLEFALAAPFGRIPRKLSLGRCFSSFQFFFSLLTLQNVQHRCDVPALKHTWFGVVFPTESQPTMREPVCVGV